MKKITLLFAWLIACNCQAQVNLVPNPSFEDTTQCNQLGRLACCKDWVECGETPDYCNAYYPGVFSVPFNVFGHQPAATGNAYCDVWTYATTELYREFIGISLVRPMVISHRYNVSFNCAPSSPYSGYCVKTNKLGVRFSTAAYSASRWAPIDNFAHVYTDEIIGANQIDTSAWTNVSGTFTADSAYTFLALGNFFDDAHTDTAGPCQAFGVYYIDDVSVVDNDSDKPSFAVWQENHLLHIATTDGIERITIYDVLGRRCYVEIGQFTLSQQISTTAFSAGLYIVELQTISQSTTTQFVIQ